MNKNKTKKKKFYGEKPKCISYAKLNYLPFSGYFFFSFFPALIRKAFA